MGMIAVIFLGYYGFRQLSIDLLPSFSYPVIFVSAPYPNVAPEEMETVVARPIEDAVAVVPGIQQVESTSFDGSATVVARFNFGVNIDTAASDVREQLDRIRNRLPNDPNFGPIGIFKADPTQLPVLIMGVNDQTMSQTQLNDLVQNQLIPQIESVPGVGAAVESGGVVREIRVEVDNARLAALNIPISTVVNRISQENQNIAGGVGRRANQEYEIRVLGLVTDPNQLLHVAIGTGKDGTPVYLGDVGHVLDTGKEQRVFGRLNGTPSVGVTVSKEADANTVAVARDLYAKLVQLEGHYPGLHFAPIYDQHFYIEDSINALKQNALIGAVLAILAILFFLHSVRSTLVIALSIPTSVAGAFLVMYLSGFTLNILTLGGLALAVGLIVDDAIVVLENIFRHVETGGERIEAAKAGAAQIYGAVVASTITVMIVFLPMLLVGGIASKIFQPFALVVVFAIGVSLLVALSVVPMLSARFIRRSDVAEAHVEASASLIARAEAWMFVRFGNLYRRLESRYRRVLEWSLDHSRQVGFVALGAIVAGVVTLGLLAKYRFEFLPPSRSNYITVNYRWPVGTALAVNNAFAQKIESELRADTANVQDVYGNIGASQSFAGFGTRQISNQGQIFVTLKPMGHGSTRTLTTDQYVQKLRERFAAEPGLQAYPAAVDIVSRILAFATGQNTGITVGLFGPDLSQLSKLGNAAAGSLRGQIPGLINLRTSITDASPEMRVIVDRTIAAQLGVPLSEVGASVAAATNGAIASEFQSNGQLYDIDVMYPQSQRKTPDQVASLTIHAPSGADVPLSELATISFAKGPNQITRQDKLRFVEIQGDVLGRPAGSVANEVQQRLSSFALPAGYRFDFTAGQQTQQQTFASLRLALILAIALIYMLLAAKYESFWQPLVIMLTLPLAIVGVGLGLLVFRQSLGLTAFIGLLTLVGIVVKNAILVVEFTNQLRAQGLDVRSALRRAGPIRMRPILMTTSATCLGLLPLGLALQPGSETQAPLAAVVIGGLVTSTLLTLVVIPVAYLSGERWMRRYLRTRFGRFVADLFSFTRPDGEVGAPAKKDVAAGLGPTEREETQVRRADRRD